MQGINRKISRNFALAIYFALFCTLLFLALSMLNIHMFFADDIQDYYLGPLRNISERGVSPFNFPISYKMGLGFNYLLEMQFGWWNIFNRFLIWFISLCFSSDYLFIKLLTSAYVFIFSFGLFLVFSQYHQSFTVSASFAFAIVFSTYNINYRFQAWIGEFYTLAWFPLVYFSFFHTKGTVRIIASTITLYLFISAGFLQYIVVGLLYIFSQLLYGACTSMQNKKIKALLQENFTNIYLLALSIALLLALCYPALNAGSFIAREFVIGYRGNEFFTFNWNDFINAIVPFYISNKTAWGGAHISGPIFFIGVPILLSLLFFDSKKKSIHHDSILFVTALSILILFLPTQFGPFRWTVRFLTFSSFYISIFLLPTVTLQNKKPSRIKIYLIGFILLATLLNAPWDIKYLLASSLALLLIIKGYTLRKSHLFLFISQVMILVVTLFLFPPFKGHFHYNDVGIVKPPAHSGLALNITRSTYADNDYLTNTIDFNGGFLTNYATVTSYSPVGHIFLNKLLCITDVHGKITCDINNPLLKPVLGGISLLNFINISTIIMDNDYYPVYEHLLQKEGFKLLHRNNTTLSFERIPKIINENIDGTLLVRVNNKSYLSNKALSIDIPMNTNSVIVPLVYWPGYKLKVGNDFWTCNPYYQKVFIKCKGDTTKLDTTAVLSYYFWGSK